MKKKGILCEILRKNIVVDITDIRWIEYMLFAQNNCATDRLYRPVAQE